MVWVLANKDRNSRLEIPCSVPIAYGLKDYRLSAAALRDATDEILEVCHQKGFHIRSLSTDGQWIQLMTRDSEHRPLTVFQLQKDVWSEVKKMSKSELIAVISKLNIPQSTSCDDTNGVSVSTERSELPNSQNTLVKIFVESTDVAFHKIYTSRQKDLWKNESKQNVSEESNSICQSNNDWLPEDLIVSMQDNSDADIANIVSTVEKSFVSKSSNDESIESNFETDLYLSCLFLDGNTPLPSIVESLDSSDQQGTDVSSADDSANVVFQEDVEDGFPRIGLSEDHFILDHLLSKLQLGMNNKWNNCTQQDLSRKLSSKEHLMKLTHLELNCLCENLRQILPTTLPTVSKSLNKERKVLLLRGMQGRSQELEMGGAKLLGEGSRGCLRPPVGPGQSPGRGALPPEALGFLTFNK